MQGVEPPRFVIHSIFHPTGSAANHAQSRNAFPLPLPASMIHGAGTTLHRRLAFLWRYVFFALRRPPPSSVAVPLRWNGAWHR
ncbi:hypothetical protein BC2230_30602 [Burkholderia cepacia]